MATQLRTKYKIRATIPAKLVADSRLQEQARELGVRIATDASGNVEGAWESSLLALEAVIGSLRQIGLRDLMIQRSVVSFAVSAGENLSEQVAKAIRAETGKDPDSCTDVLAGGNILRFAMSCEKAQAFANVLRGLGVCNIIACESYEVEIENACA
jgi:hypothetical protein